MLRVIFTARHKTGALDLEAVEMALRAALQQAGAAGLSQLLRQESPAEPYLPCSCGGQARYKGMRTKPLLTVLGRAEMQRAYYWCSRCQQGQFSADAALDVENTELSPGVRRMLTLVGSECSSFERGREQMKLLAGLEVTTKAVERTTESIGADIAQREQGTIQQALQRELPIAVGQAIPVMYVQMDGTGVPMVSKELQGRKGKGSNGRAHTREVKLGCVFTQTTVDAEGWPVRDEDSTTYTGAIETAEEFSRRLYTEAQQRGWDRAQKKVVMGDGAEWIWNRTQEIFPGATEIVDLYHARQHLWDLSSKLHPSDVAAKRRWVMSHQHFLDDGKSNTGESPACPGHRKAGIGGGNRDRGQLFRAQCGAHALPEVPQAAAVRGLRSDRSGLQNPHRHPSQTLRNVLDRSRRQCGHRRPLLPSQPRIRRLLGVPPAMIAPSNPSPAAL